MLSQSGFSDQAERVYKLTSPVGRVSVTLNPDWPLTQRL